MTTDAMKFSRLFFLVAVALFLTIPMMTLDAQPMPIRVSYLDESSDFSGAMDGYPVFDDELGCDSCSCESDACDSYPCDLSCWGRDEGVHGDEELYGNADAAARDWLRLDVRLTDALLDFQNRQTDKELFILQDRARRRGRYPTVIVGGQSRLSFLAAATNSTDKFPYLGRFPTDFGGDTATDARMLHANAHATAHVTSFASVYTELLFSDVFSFRDFKQGSLQVRQAYAVIGDLSDSPFYLYLGKKNIGFGDFSTLSPFTQTVTWHYFAALGEGIGGGYHDDSWDITLAGINGGRGIRVNDSTERGKLNNVAANVTYKRGDAIDRRFRIGGGFLLGTIYDGMTAEHLDANQFGTQYNSAWSVNTRWDIDRVSLASEYVTTTERWPVTNSIVSAFHAEAAYWFDRGPRGSQLSVSWGSGEQGASGTEFEFNNQLVVGYGRRFGLHCRASIEYVRSIGFAPLMNITTVSDRDVAQDSLVFGLNLIL